MDLGAIWQQFAIAGYQIWVWVQYELGAHPYLIVGAAVVIILALTLYRMEVKVR
jgi:hypothetical protein